jgi:hypothetical protein
MRLPNKETTLYENPTGGSNISDVPMNTPINPNLIVNEYGQTMINQDIPKPLNPLDFTTPKEQAQQLALDVKESLASLISAPTEPKKDFGTIMADKKAVETAKSITPKKTTNYLLYGVLGLGVIVVLLGVFKKK